MDDVESPYILLNWLQSGSEEMQLSALEQLCLALLQYESNETLIKFYPPSTYIPILACLCQDFDISFVLLEAIIRTMTYYMQALPHEVINRLVNTKGSLVAICMRLENPNMTNPVESDLTQQIIKLLEELCKRDTKSLANIGGTSYVISFMSRTYQIIHLDTIKSGFYILYKIIDKIDPSDCRLAEWFEFLSNFFKHSDFKIVEYSLHCLLSIVKACNDKKISTDHLGIEKIIDDLLEMTMVQLKMDNQTSHNQNPNDTTIQNTNNKVGLSKVIIDLILCIIRGSHQFLHNLLVKSKLVDIILEITWQYDSSSISILQLIEGMFDQIMERTTYKSNENIQRYKLSTALGMRVIHNRMYSEEMIQQYWNYHEHLLKAIVNGNVDHLKELLLSTDFDPNFKDIFGQTSLNWASAIGLLEAVNLLLTRGIDPNLGERGTSLHYAAAQGHISVIKALINNQTMDFYVKDVEGITVTERLEQFIKLNSNPNKIEEINDFILKIENQKLNVKTDIILTKQFFIKRIIPILIKIYFKNYKPTLRYHVLELLGKIFQSFSHRDHETFISEIYQENSLPYHLSKLVYRVLLQDSGENILEAMKCCLYLTSDNEYSNSYLMWFNRMGIKDIIQTAMSKLNIKDQFDYLLKEKDERIIPLTYNIEFSENKNVLKTQAYSLNLHQPYYWGDWNIFKTDDGLNLYNEYCYIFISTEESVKNLRCSILTRKTFVDELLSKGSSKDFVKNQLFESLNKTGYWKNLSEDHFNKEPNIRKSQENETDLKSDYVAVEINDKNIYHKKDLIPILLEKYSAILLSMRPVTLPIQFPKLPTGKAINLNHLIISSFTNQLKISCKYNKDENLKIDEKNENNTEITEIPNVNEQCFIEISINSIAGVIMKFQNQILYKSGPLNKQAGLKRLGLSNSSYESSGSSKDLKPPKNLLKDSICFRINSKFQLFNSQLESVDKLNGLFGKTVSKLLSVLESKKCQKKEVVKYITTLDSIISSEEENPTPYELYKSKFIKVLEILFQKYSDDFLDDLLVIIYNNLPKITKILIQLTEQIENLPISYQIHHLISEHYLTRSIHLNVKLRNCNDHKRFDVDPIPDLSKYNFLVMPLSSPSYTKKRINNLLQKLPWYRAEKRSFNSFKELLSDPYYVNIPYNDGNHQKGVFHWLATNGFHSDLFMNPLKLDLISVMISENSSSLLNSFNNLFTVANNTLKEKNLFNKNYVSVRGQNCFLTIQLKPPLGLIPTHYKLACPSSAELNSSNLLNWKLLASIDGLEWDTLSTHINDSSALQSNTSWFVWTLEIDSSILEKVKNHGWTLFKIQHLNLDSSKNEQITIADQKNLCNNWHSSSSIPVSSGLSISSIEFYGTVYSISEDKQKEIKDQIDIHLSNFKLKSLVLPGPDWVFDNRESYKIGKTLTLIKNGTVLVEWLRDSEKCHIRHKMGSQGKYEILLASQEQIEALNDKNDVIKNNLTDSIIESRSSNEFHQVSHENFRHSFQDSISWIIDPNISMPLRTSSLSSQRNSRLPSISNKDNWMDKEISRDFNNFQESLDDNRDNHIIVQSETEDFDLQYENSEFELTNVDINNRKADLIKKDDRDITANGKSLFQMKDTITVKNNDTNQLKNQQFSKSIDDFKKSFSMNKQTKRKSHQIVNMLTDSKNEILKKDIIKFNTLTEDIEMSDQSEEYEVLQCPENFLKRKKNYLENSEITQNKPSVKRKPYNPFGKNNKFKQTITSKNETNMKFKPISIEQPFPGLVQAIDHRSTSALTQILSNVENLNYRPNKKFSKPDETTKIKKFGYDSDQFRLKFQIQKLLPANRSLYYQKFNDFKASNFDWLNSDLQLENHETDQKTYEFILKSDSTFPIANYVLKMLPSPDPILNIYPIDNVSEIWHSQFTLFYGFCDKKGPGTSCQNCFYQKIKTSNEATDKNKKPANEIDKIFSILHHLKCSQLRFIEKTKNQVMKLQYLDVDWLDLYFISQHMCKKVLSQLEDVWSLISRDTLPSWIVEWPQKYPFVFFYDVKIDILKAFWFGVSRSVIWLQQRAKPNSDFIRPSFRDDLVAPFHFLGRLKKHIAQIPRPYYFGNTILTEAESRSIFWSAVRDLLVFHAKSKEELEIQFDQEEGTGLGPTLEFINILSKEFMRPSLLMWVHTDSFLEEENEFVFSKNGLFPYPWPADKLTEELLEKFRLLGIFMAKSLQDNRIMDLPFSELFLEILCKDFSDYNKKEYLKRFMLIYPERGLFLMSIELFCEEKQKLLKTINEAGNRTLWKVHDQLKCLAIETFGTTFDGLCLDMEFLPTSKIYGTVPFPLYDHYWWEDDSDSHDDICNMGYEKDSFHEPVTENNAENYLQRTLNFAMNKGIKKQFAQIIDGFNEVFPIKSLSMFSSSELKQLLCGEQHIQWSLIELQNYTEPTQGYISTSKSYQYFLEVLLELNQIERKMFVQFISGCSSLPPGGLKNLKPRLTIVKKNVKDGPYPSVNTCMHYLKLPEYETKSELKLKLLEACNQIGFYLN